MSRLDRYVFSECLGPVAIGFLISTGLFLVGSFFELAEAMIQREVPLSAALKLLALNLPHIVVITIPMALLFGILVAVGRLSADSEITALRASGVSLSHLYRPILALSVVLAIFNAVLMVRVLPWGNQALRRLMVEELLKGNQAHAVEPRIFNEILDGRTLYVFGLSPERKTWQGVFLADAVPLGEFTFTVAQEGNIRIENGGRRLIAAFKDALDQTLDLDAPEEAQLSSNENLELVLEEETATGPSGSTSSGLRELSLSELWDVLQDPEEAVSLRNRAAIEIHKKFSIPAACIVFGLLALPLGYSRNAGGKSSAFVQALIVIVLYHLMQSIGEEAAAQGKFAPWLAMWLPNAVFMVAGAFILTRRNEDKGLLWTRVDRWIRQHSWRYLRRRATQSSRQLPGSAVPRQQHRFLFQIPHFSVRFPGRLDRYVLRLFAQIAVLVIAICITIYVIGDLAKLAEAIVSNQIPLLLVAEHYLYHSLQIFYTIAPMAVLLTTLIVFGLLSRSSETTAVKALGMSLYRLAVPALVGGLVVAGAVALLDLSLLPAANARQAELRVFIKGKSPVDARRRVSRQWFYSEANDGGSFIYNYLLASKERQAIQRFQAFRFDAGHRLTGHLYAGEIRRVGDRWFMQDGWARSFDGSRMTEYREMKEPRPLDLAEGPEFFSTEIKSSQEMNYWELRSYVQRLKSSGQLVPDLELQLYNKIAMPVVCVVMVFVALPFSFRMGRQGALYGIGIALLLGMLQFAVLALFTTLGETAILEPRLAAWAPNLLFTLLSLYLFLGVRS